MNTKIVDRLTSMEEYIQIENHNHQVPNHMILQQYWSWDETRGLQNLIFANGCYWTLPYHPSFEQRLIWLHGYHQCRNGQPVKSLTMMGCHQFLVIIHTRSVRFLFIRIRTTDHDGWCNTSVDDKSGIAEIMIAIEDSDSPSWNQTRRTVMVQRSWRTELADQWCRGILT